MAEEKKSGWFQKFKSAVFGGEAEAEKQKETVSMPADEPAEAVAIVSEEIISEQQEPDESLHINLLDKPDESLHINLLEKTTDVVNNVTPVMPDLTDIITEPVPENLKTEEQLLKDTFQTEVAKTVVQDTEPDVKPAENTVPPVLNVKLEIGKGKIPFQKSENDSVKINEPVKKEIRPESGFFKKLGTAELMLDLRSQDTPLPHGITEETNTAKAEPVNEIKTDEETVSQEPVASETENNQPEQESEKKKSWFTKVVNTLNSPIEFKIETPEGDDSWLAKLKGNVSVGLGKPVVEQTDEDIAKWREKLREKLSLTRESFVARLERLMHGRTTIDDELLEEIEEILLESDVGVEMTDKISKKLRTLAKEKRFLPAEVMPSLFDFLKEQLEPEPQRIIVDESRLNIILMVGVNGTGKTTTTGKIAAKLRISDYSVILAAADTFRAAAIDQLDVWSQRAQVPIVKHEENSDAAAVVFDAIKASHARKTNVLVIDTAGRLHNKSHLMDELKKIKRIIDREAPEAKLEVLLVLDAITGQNGLKQATVFSDAVQLTGVVLTKLDGTAKGGVIFSIRDTLKLPIKLVGVGEGIEDLRDFEPQIFIDALFSEKNQSLIEESTKIRS